MVLSPFWQTVNSIGHAVLLGLAISGAIRLGGIALGTPVSPSTAGNVFMLSSLLLMPLTIYFRVGNWVSPVAPPRR